MHPVYAICALDLMSHSLPSAEQPISLCMTLHVLYMLTARPKPASATKATVLRDEVRPWYAENVLLSLSIFSDGCNVSLILGAARYVVNSVVSDESV
jgi:hypothetical protein